MSLFPAQSPLSIVAFLAGPGLGDLILRGLIAAVLKATYPGSRLIAYINPKTRDQTDALLLFPFVDQFLFARPDLPFDFLHRQSWDRQPGSWARLDNQFTPLVRSNVFVQVEHTPLLEGACGALGAWRAFDLPESLKDGFEKDLLGLGLDRRRWYVTLHAREGGYRGHSQHARSVSDPQVFRQLCDYIIDRQGGQVVRIGDSKMSVFAPRPGLIDLTQRPNSLLLQAFAMAGARYFIGTDSGPDVVARGFGVPTGLTNLVRGVIDRNRVTVTPDCILLTKWVQAGDGAWVCDQDMLDRGLHRLDEEEWNAHPERLRDNSLDELIAVVDALYDQTQSHSPGSWRSALPSGLDPGWMTAPYAFGRHGRFLEGRHG